MLHIRAEINPQEKHIWSKTETTQISYLGQVFSQFD